MPPSPSRAGIRRVALALGLIAVAALAIALGLYDPLAASLAALVAAASFAAVARHPQAPFLAFATIGTVLLWLAFGTTGGHFWLNRHRFEAILAELDAAPGLVSLELGMEDRVRRADGTWRSFDSYRFVNGTVVTHHAAQVAPHAAQPVLPVEDALRSADVSVATYWRLRHALQRLSLGGLHRGSRGAEGQITLMEPREGGSPWTTGYVFSPSGRMPQQEGIETFTHLAPRWFYVRSAI